MKKITHFRAMQGLSFYPNEENDLLSGNAGAFLLPTLGDEGNFSETPMHSKIADHLTDLLSSKLIIS
jgi:hypothetical protein